MSMIRKNFYLTREQNDFLKKTNQLSVSEHIRRAIDEYILKIRTSDVSMSKSSSYHRDETGDNSYRSRM